MRNKPATDLKITCAFCHADGVNLVRVTMDGSDEPFVLMPVMGALTEARKDSISKALLSAVGVALNEEEGTYIKDSEYHKA